MGNFSDEERERIEAEMMKTGEDLIAKYGFKKTTIKDITEPVGIAESTFYVFFDSKTEFYVNLLGRAHMHMLDQIDSELKRIDDPEKGIEKLFQLWVQNHREHPILLKSKTEEMDWRGIDENVFREQYDRAVGELGEIINKYIQQSSGPLSELQPDDVLHILQFIEELAVLSFDNIQFDEEWLRNIIIRSLAQGLTSK